MHHCICIVYNCFFLCALFGTYGYWISHIILSHSVLRDPFVTLCTYLLPWMVLNHLQHCHPSLQIIYNMDSRSSSPHACKNLMVSSPCCDAWSLLSTTCFLHRKVPVQEPVSPPQEQLSTQRIHPAFLLWLYHPSLFFSHLSNFLALESCFTHFLLCYEKHSCYCFYAFIELFINS